MIKPSVPELGSFDWVHLDSNCSESNVHHLGVGVLLVEFEQVVRSNVFSTLSRGDALCEISARLDLDVRE
jgi:hypothetical protein